ncbi:MAG TPA: site-specific integrase [Streptosporangiaceae bacterium]
MTAASGARQAGALFSSAGPAAAAFISDGATRPARSARAWSVQRLEDTFGGLAGWLAAPLARRLDAPVDVRGAAVWLALATAAPIDAAYVARCHAGWGYRLADLEPRLAARFTTTAARLGYNGKQADLQWAALAKLAAVAGLPAGQLDRPRFDAARDALAAAVLNWRGRLPNSLTTPLHGLQATLAAMGILDEPQGRRVTGRGIPARWDHLESLAPELAGTMRRYLAQLAISMRPGSVALADTTLRHFAVYLTAHHRDITAAAQIRRTHIEGFKAWLDARPGYRGRRSPAATTIGMRLGHLRCFFDRIIEWGYHDAPARNPVFSGDNPIRDRPLPRFLDDADATALLAAGRQLPSLFDRVAVEVLARTGLRKGEFLRLATDAVVRIGDGEWLHVPVGKLHTDRYIPLHPRVKTLLAQWHAQRDGQPGKLMFTDHGRPIPQTRVDAAVRRAATVAGIGHVTPHQLRHTLATQAINRGMSLEAIAALLGHRSMSMTLTYARIADRTVAEEYFAVSQQVEALYDAEPVLPAAAEGPNMRRLHTETTRRLLGNGYCTRPAELGCRYETICETCSFFTTTIEFRDQLQAQQTDAERHGDTSRQTAYLKILDTLDTTGT